MRDFAFRMLITILGFASYDAVAQSVISTAGNSFERSGMTITFTIGELATETCYSDNSILTQGFHQPRQQTSAIGIVPESASHIVFYPNPTRDYITVSVTERPVIILDIEIMNISGKKLMKFSAETDQFLIDLDRFPAGIYYLRIVDTQSDQISTHKVIKY